MTIAEIEEKLTTSQQMAALSVYSHDGHTMDFQEWYSLWCTAHHRYNDINESNFEVQGRPDWAEEEA